MNRAWIPAGALASVSVLGLIALGPLTDSLSTPVKFSGVVTVAAPTPKSGSVPVNFPAVVVGQTKTAALRRGGAARATPTNSDFGQVAAKISKRAPTPTVQSSPAPTAPSAPATPVKRKVKRPTSISGSTGANEDVGLASGGSGNGSGGGGEQTATPGTNP